MIKNNQNQEFTGESKGLVQTFGQTAMLVIPKPLLIFRGNMRDYDDWQKMVSVVKEMFIVLTTCYCI